MSTIRKIRRQQERKESPMKVLQGLSNLSELADLSTKIDEFTVAAKKMEGMVESLEGAEGLIESVVQIKGTFESLVRRQTQCELVVKEILRLLYQGKEEIDLKLKQLEDSLGEILPQKRLTFDTSEGYDHSLNAPGWEASTSFEAKRLGDHGP
jgi:hypothetical protein